MAVQYLRIQIRRDSKANWSAANPVLLLGEVGYETDTKRSKTGDGVHTWSNLPYDKAGIVAVGEGLEVDADGVLTNTYDHSADIGDLGDNATVKAYVDTQDAATLQSASDYADGAVDVEKAQRMTEDAAIRDDLEVEQTARENRDNNLQGQIDANLVEFQTYSAATGTRLQTLETDPTTGTEVDQALDLAKAYTDVEQSRATTAEAAIQADVDANELASDAADAALAGRLDTLEAGSSVEGSVAEAKKAGDDAKADAATAQAAADAAQTTADANTLAIADKANSADVYSTGQVYTKAESDGLLTALLANDNVGPDHAWTGQNSFSQTITGDITGNAASADVASDSAPGSTLAGALANRVVKGEFTALSTTLAANETDPATIAAALVQLVSDLNDIGA